MLENIAEILTQDETLRPLFAKVVVEAKMNDVGKEHSIVDNGVLYTVNDAHRCLVIPASCSQLIMHLAHTLQWSGTNPPMCQ